MKLLHNAYVTNLSPEEIVASALTNRTVEVDLAVSGCFFSYHGNIEKAWGAYQAYFKTMVVELDKVLGKHLFRGNSCSPDKAKSATNIRIHVELLDNIVIWEKDGVEIYLRYEQEDRDLPIHIALGTQGCKGTKVTYPEPPPYYPTKEEEEADWLKEQREYYDILGVESKTEKCKKEECNRGRISSSVFCRVHHFERYNYKPCPFND